MIIRIAFLLIVSYNSFAQVPDLKTKMDFFKGVWHYTCADLGIVNFDNYKSKVSAKEKEQIGQMILLLNDFGKDYLTADSLVMLTKPFQVSYDTIGLVRRIKFCFYNGIYSGYGLISTINNIIIYKFIQAEFSKKIEAIDSLKKKRDNFLDYKLVESFVPKLDRSGMLKELYGHSALFVLDTTYSERLIQLQTKGSLVLFVTQSKDSSDIILFNEIASVKEQGFYSPVYPSKAILSLINAKNTDLLTELLRSYNYCAQVSAMEAIWYMQLKKEFTPDANTLKLMNEIRSMNYKLHVLDSFHSSYHVKNYGSLAMHDACVIAKFENYLLYKDVFTGPF
jgi:hypothetical protein